SPRLLTLPPEITCEIFLLCLPDKREHDVVNPMEAPLLLTHVCGAWRQMAISFPRLWTTFEVVCPMDVPDLYNIAEAWFERSHNLPISMKIHGALTVIQDRHGLLPKTLRQHSSRMRSLDLNLELYILYKVNFRIVDWALLETLSIRLFENQIDLDDELVAEFGRVPRLREVFVGEIPPSLITLPWQQLTKFTGEMYTAAQCLEALKLMSNLLECAFSVSEDDDEDDDDLEVYSHASILHFTLFESESEDHPTCSAKLLEFITLPALRTLDLHVEDFNEGELGSFLERSQPPLQKLSVRSLDSNLIQLQLSSLGMVSDLT
ncbi:hypothetical protein B0H16DRAFT_1258715, partial [Mycena metata]